MCQIDILLNDDGDDTTLQGYSKNFSRTQISTTRVIQERINEAAESFIVMVVKMESKLLLMELNFKQVLFKL